MGDCACRVDQASDVASSIGMSEKIVKSWLVLGLQHDRLEW